MKNNVKVLSIIFLGICFIIGCWLLSRSFSPKFVTASSTNYQSHQLLTHSELADYLGISEADADKLGPNPADTRVATSLLPYVKIGNTIYFPQKAVDAWLAKTEAVTIQ